MDESWRRQSAARRRLAALQPLDARCGRPAREWEAAIEAFFRTRTRRRSPPKDAAAASMPPWSPRRPTCLPIRICARADSGGHADGEPRAVGRFVSMRVRGRSPCAAAMRSRAPPSTRRAAGRRARAGFFLGAGRLDHHQDAGRPGLRGHQGRVAHAPLPVASRRAGQRLARRQLRRQALVRAPEYLQAAAWRWT